MKDNLLNNNKVEAFVYYFSRLNSDGLASILSEDTIQDSISIKDWINIFENQFESFKRNEIHYLKPIIGSCTGCKMGCLGYTFLDELEGFYIDLAIEIDNEKIIGFSDCLHLTNESLISDKKEQIFINEKSISHNNHGLPF